MTGDNSESGNINPNERMLDSVAIILNVVTTSRNLKGLPTLDLCTESQKAATTIKEAAAEMRTRTINEEVFRLEENNKRLAAARKRQSPRLRRHNSNRRAKLREGKGRRGYHENSVPPSHRSLC